MNRNRKIARKYFEFKKRKEAAEQVNKAKAVTSEKKEN